MACNKIEDFFTEYETISDTAFVSNISKLAFSNLCFFNPADLLGILFFDKDYHEDLPHIVE
jgi:hypothetical protein